MINNKRRSWPKENELIIKYHDLEWGIPVLNDQILFEFLITEGAQACLSWQTVLNKREIIVRLSMDLTNIKLPNMMKKTEKDS
ncbi:MAG: 3-methyladenine DNA glycosylase Tag [Lentimonas sp.]|jgi:3-methyladenine DNA glycosylase Tag